VSDLLRRLPDGGIDAHQHYWEAHRRFPIRGNWWSGSVSYSWVEAGVPELGRDCMPDDLEPQLRAGGVGSSVVVQAIHADGETRWLLELASARESIAGVVGWVDLTQGEEHVTRDLEAIAHPKLVGIRHMAPFEADAGWLVRHDVVTGLKAVQESGLAFDLLLTPRELTFVPELSERLPDLNMVVDHVAKPPIVGGALEPWASMIRAAAENPRIFCKLSGMVTEADRRSWTATDLRPYIEVVLDAFGPRRCMYGSDWPVCTLAGSYERVQGALAENLDLILAGDTAAMAAIKGEVAARFYGLG
jgi:L-fuconolactonase